MNGTDATVADFSAEDYQVPGLLPSSTGILDRLGIYVPFRPSIATADSLLVVRDVSIGVRASWVETVPTVILQYDGRLLVNMQVAKRWWTGDTFTIFGDTVERLLKAAAQSTSEVKL